MIILITLALWGCALTNQRDQTGRRPRVNSWKGSIDDGDKPGIGLILSESAGEITGGTFYLLDPDEPHNFKAAGQTAQLRDIHKTTQGISFTFDLRERQETKSYTNFLVFSDQFTGNNVHAILTASLSRNAFSFLA